MINNVVGPGSNPLEHFVLGQRILVHTRDYEPRPAVVVHLSSMEGGAWVDLEGHDPGDDDGYQAETNVFVELRQCTIAPTQEAGPPTSVWVRTASFGR